MKDESTLRLNDGIYFAAIPGAKGALVSRDRAVVLDAERKLLAYGPMLAALRLVSDELTDPYRRSAWAVLVSGPCRKAVAEALCVVDGGGPSHG